MRSPAGRPVMHDPRALDHASAANGVARMLPLTRSPSTWSERIGVSSHRVMPRRASASRRLATGALPRERCRLQTRLWAQLKTGR